MQRFRECVEARDLDGLVAALAEDVVFRSPVVFKPYEGREAVGALLRGVAEVFEDFRYVREYASPDGRHHALMFETRVGDRELEGCDFLHTDEHGQVDELLVMVRPVSAALALAEAMQAHFAGAGGVPAA